MNPAFPFYIWILLIFTQFIDADMVTIPVEFQRNEAFVF